MIPESFSLLRVYGLSCSSILFFCLLQDDSFKSKRQETFCRNDLNSKRVPGYKVWVTVTMIPSMTPSMTMSVTKTRRFCYYLKSTVRINVMQQRLSKVCNDEAKNCRNFLVSWFGFLLSVCCRWMKGAAGGRQNIAENTAEDDGWIWKKFLKTSRGRFTKNVQSSS